MSYAHVCNDAASSDLQDPWTTTEETDTKRRCKQDILLVVNILLVLAGVCGLGFLVCKWAFPGLETPPDVTVTGSFVVPTSPAALHIVNDQAGGIPDVLPRPEDQGASINSFDFEQELGASMMSLDNLDCWKPCNGRSGWCSWCGSGMACCRKGSKFDPVECLGFGGSNGHRCVRIPGQPGAQCGGHNWQGPTACVPGYSCVSESPSYSQCRFAEAEQKTCAASYETCRGWAQNAPWEKCCPDGHSCSTMNSKNGVSKSQCVPSSLFHPGADCFEACNRITGDCKWCGKGNACCMMGQHAGPPECADVQFLTSATFQCVAAGQRVEVKHQGQSCLEHCDRKAGSCTWCGDGKACCPPGMVNGPTECLGLSISAPAGMHVCVQISQHVAVKHQSQDCLQPCNGRAGYCQWCGKGMACCLKGSTSNPAECFGASDFSRSDVHVCVTTMLLSSSHIRTKKPIIQHAGEDCWYSCKGSGFCSWCGEGNACCRKGAFNDRPECSGVTEFSSDTHHVCAVVPSVINKVSITPQKPFRVLFDGLEMGPGGKVRGVAGSGTHALEAREAGVDAFRTWSAEQTNAALAAAGAVGLKVAAGLYVTTFKDKYVGEFCNLDHPWWQDELDHILANVTVNRNNRALLWWQVGNELELAISWAEGSECLWKRLEWIVAHVKRYDPNHPVGTAIAGFHVKKMSSLNLLCPSLDFVGLNVYGGDAYNIAEKLEGAGWHRPYAITEYGAAGAWMVPQTPWGAPVEPTSTQKGLAVREIHKHCLMDDMCLGTFAFIWGWKWEFTPTWFSTFNEWRAAGGDEPKSDMVDIMQEVWTGAVSKNPAPRISALRVWDGATPKPVNLGFTSAQGAVVRVDIAAVDLPADDDDAWSDNEVLWVLTEETVPGQQYGDASVIEGAVKVCEGHDARSRLNAIIDTSILQDGHTYRLYAFVRDYPGNVQRSSCTFPGVECDKAVRFAMTEGTSQHPDWYPGLNTSSSYVDIQQLMFQQNKCPPPCPKTEGVSEASVTIPFKVCKDAASNDPCGLAIHEAMTVGIQRDPAKYTGLTSKSTFRDFQKYFHSNSEAGCQAPCDDCTDVSQDSVCAQNVWQQMTHMLQPLTAPFSGASMWTSFPELQSILKRYNKGNCPQPCSLALSSDVHGQCPN